MKKSLLNCCGLFLGGGIILLNLTGCISQYKIPCYSTNNQTRALCDINKVKYPRIIEILDRKQEVQDWRRKGYEVIGTSFFYDIWRPRTLAIDLAREHGASVILVCYKFVKEKDQIISSTVPHSHTDFSSGVVTDNYGNPATYTAAVHTTSYSTSINTYTRTYYNQYLYFLARRHLTNEYGVYFVRPPSIPGEKNRERVIVDLVIADSQAEKAGIRPGDTVLSINGNILEKFEEAEKYMLGEKKIESMVVRHD